MTPYLGGKRMTRKRLRVAVYERFVRAAMRAEVDYYRTEAERTATWAHATDANRDEMMKRIVREWRESARWTMDTIEADFYRSWPR